MDLRSPVTLPIYLDLLAVFLGGLAGSLRGANKRFAITGVIALAIAAGLGGGILRDLLLQRGGPPVALTEPSYLPTVLVAAAIGFFFGSLVSRFGKLIVLMDAVWLGLYAVVGADKALALHFSPVSAILVGSIAATGGSVLMDILAGDKPELVRPGPIGHFGAVVGAVLFVVLVEAAGLPGTMAMLVTVVVVFAIRVAALRFGIQVPTPVDIPETISKAARGLKQRGKSQGDDSQEGSPDG